MVGQARGRRTSKMRLWQRPRRRQQAALPGHREQEQKVRGPTRTRGPAGERRRGVRATAEAASTQGQRDHCLGNRGMLPGGNTENTPATALPWTVLRVALSIASHCQQSRAGEYCYPQLTNKETEAQRISKMCPIVRRWKKLRITSSQFGALSAEFEGRDGSRGLPNLGEVALTFLQPERPCSIFLELTGSSRRQPLQWTIFEIPCCPELRIPEELGDSALCCFARGLLARSFSPVTTSVLAPSSFFYIF